MAVTEVIPLGVPTTLVANQSYAMPPIAVYVTAVDMTVLEQSVDNSTWVAIVASANATLIAAPFLRSTAAGNIVVVKKH